MAISDGTTVKTVQRMLGHASAAMTLDIYAGFIDDDLDAVGNGSRTRPAGLCGLSADRRPEDGGGPAPDGPGNPTLTCGMACVLGRTRTCNL